MRGLALLVLALAPAQDDGAAAVVERMDAALGDFRDATMSVTAPDRDVWFPVSVHGTVRLQIRRSGESVLRATLAEAAVAGGDVSFLAATGADTAVFEARPHARAQGPDAPLHLRTKTAFTPAALGDADFLILPTAYPVRLFIDEPFLYYALAPKRHFGLVPGLEVVAREPRIVLRARTTIRGPIRALGLPLIQSGTLERRFIVDPRTHRLERLVWRLDIGGAWGWIRVADVAERDARGLPKRLRIRETNIFRGRLTDREGHERSVTVESVNTGFEIPGADPSGAYGDAVLKPAAEYRQAIEEDAGDVAAHAGLALALLWPKRVSAAILDAEARTDNDGAAAEPLRALARLRPDDAAVRSNLLALTTEAPARAELLRGAGGALAFVRARESLEAGRAAEALEALPPEEAHTRDAIRAVRAAALIRAGRAVEAGAVLGDAAAWALLSPADHAALRESAERLPDAALLQLARASAEDARAAEALLATLLRRPSPDAGVRAGAAALALRLGAKGLAGDLKDTVEGLLLARRPREAWALLRKGTPGVEHQRAAMQVIGDLADQGAPGEALEAFVWLLRCQTTDWMVFDDSLRHGFARAYASLPKPEDLLAHLPEPLTGNALMLTREMVRATSFEADVLKRAGERLPSEADAKRLQKCMTATGAARFLQLYPAAEVKDAELLCAMAQRSVPDAALPLYERAAVAGLPEWAESSALLVAAHVGPPERARALAAHVRQVPAGGEEMLTLAGAFARIGLPDRAEAMLVEAENVGRRPHVARGQFAEQREDYESAMRWYNRGAREGGDAVEVGGYALTATEARKRLRAKIGEDYFADRLLAAPAEALPAEDEREVRRLYSLLMADEIGSRDEAVEALAAMGRRALPAVRDGLKAADEDVRTRARLLLRRIAEPQ